MPVREFQPVYASTYRTQRVRSNSPPTGNQATPVATSTPGATQDTGTSPIDDFLNRLLAGPLGQFDSTTPTGGAVPPAAPNTAPMVQGFFSGLGDLGTLALVAVLVFGGMYLYKEYA